MKILVIGSSNMDMVIGVENIPVIGETIIGTSLQYLAGGKGANQAFACGKLGGDTTFLTAVGSDDFGAILRTNLENAGVDMSRVKISSAPTGTAVIHVNKNGNNCISVIAGANADCDLEYIHQNEDLVRMCDILLAQLEIPPDGVYHAIELASRLGKTVVLNPAPAPDSIPKRIYPMLSYITPNETELQKLTKMPVDTMDGVKVAAKALHAKGVRNVLVTLGGQGALLVNESGEQHFAPPDIPVVDTTAAGDTFNAAIAVALGEGLPIEKAIAFANLAGTITVSRSGAQVSVPSLVEVREFAASIGVQSPV